MKHKFKTIDGAVRRIRELENAVRDRDDLLDRWSNERLALAMHGDDPQAIAWFRNEILKGDRGKLILHSKDIGDDIGRVTVTELKS